MLVAGDEYRYQGESVICKPTDVFKESAHSGSWSSERASFNDLQLPSPAILPSSLDRKNRLSALTEDHSGRCISSEVGENTAQVFPKRVSKHRADIVGRTQSFQFLRVRPPRGTEAQPASLPDRRMTGDWVKSVLARSESREARSEEGEANVPHLESNRSDKHRISQWNFELVASLQAKPCSLASDAIAAIDFDATGTRFATGGISRKIRVCGYRSSSTGLEDADEDDDDFEEERGTGPNTVRRKRGKRKKEEVGDDVEIQNHDQAAVRVICTPAKLSSLKWRPLGSNVIGCGDYDGVVMEWDVEYGLCLSERYEHSGQRIWSVDYSCWFPFLCASASGDGTVRIWTHNSDKSVGIIRSPGRNSICCAEFSSSGAHHVAVACADSKVYLYDLRKLESSLLCLEDHRRAASYVRFLSESELVSASIDSTVKLWDISSNDQASPSCSNIKLVHNGGRLLRTFESHRNVRNFVGLSVLRKEGLIACGSELNELVVYGKGMRDPLWRMKFPCREDGRMRRSFSHSVLSTWKDDEEDDINSFVGAVCWKEQADHHSLIAANSEGTVQVLKVSINGA